MKRKIILSVALVVSLTILLLVSSDPGVGAQNRIRVVADTGVIALGPNQVLRIVIDPSDPTGDTFVRFRQIRYGQGTCDGAGVCKHDVVSQNTSDPVTLTPDEAASIDIPASFQGGVFVGVRGVVLSNSRDAQVTMIVFDTSTQRVVAIIKKRDELQMS